MTYPRSFSLDLFYFRVVFFFFGVSYCCPNRFQFLYVCLMSCFPRFAFTICFWSLGNFWVPPVPLDGLSTLISGFFFFLYPFFLNSQNINLSILFFSSLLLVPPGVLPPAIPEPFSTPMFFLLCPNIRTQTTGVWAIHLFMPAGTFPPPFPPTIVSYVHISRGLAV